MQDTDIDVVDGVQCVGEVLGEDGGGEPEFAVARQAEGGVDGACSPDRQDRAEQFLTPRIARLRG